LATDAARRSGGHEMYPTAAQVRQSRTAGCRHLQQLDTSHGLRSDGPHLSPSRMRSRVAPVAAWIFQPAPMPGNHEAGSGRPSPRRSQDMPNYHQPHAYYAGVDLHARTLFLHICDPSARSASRRTLGVQLVGGIRHRRGDPRRPQPRRRQHPPRRRPPSRRLSSVGNAAHSRRSGPLFLAVHDATEIAAQPQKW